MKQETGNSATYAERPYIGKHRSDRGNRRLGERGGDSNHCHSNHTSESKDRRPEAEVCQKTGEGQRTEYYARDQGRDIRLAEGFDSLRRKSTRRELYDPLGDRHEHRRDGEVKAVNQLHKAERHHHPHGSCDESPKLDVHTVALQRRVAT